MRDLGSRSARVLVVGGCPVNADVLANQVFASPIAWKTFSMLRAAGLRRPDCYFTYQTKRLNQHAYLDLDEVVQRGFYTQDELLEGEHRLQQLAAEMPNLDIIVTQGNYPTHCFVPHGKVKWDIHKTDISKVRGSVYPLRVKGRDIRVIPMLDPLKVTNHQQWERRARLDWVRVYDQLHNPSDTPERFHNISPTTQDIHEFWQGLGKDDVVSIDIETWGGAIKCIGFAKTPYESLVVPTELSYWNKKGEQLGAGDTYGKDALAIAWEIVKDICAEACDKVLQNGLFDAWWLAKSGVYLSGYHWDTLGMHHALFPDDSHSLDYLGSIYTLQPYWKDEAKAADEIVRIARQGMDKLYVYNGLDVCVTREVYDILYDMLADADRLGFYLRHYADMHQPLLNLMLRGVRVDHQKLLETRQQLRAEAVTLRDRAVAIAGQPLYTSNTQLEKAIYEAYTQGNTDLGGIQEALAERKDAEKIPVKFAAQQEKGISDQRLASVLWDDLGAPKGKSTKTGKRKVDDISLRRLKLDVEARKRIKEDKRAAIIELVDLTLDHRRKRKLSTFVDPKNVDDDHRLRCTYKFTTKTGRLASSGNPGGTGLNLQNVDRKIRHLFIPSPGHVMLEVDLSQAESRVVGALTGHAEMIAEARMRPDAYDVHTANACMIYSHIYQREVKPDEVTYEMRYLGKRAVHAASYGMRGNRLSEILLKDGQVYTPNECQGLIDAYMEMRPAVRSWQGETRDVMCHHRTLFTSWGRQIDFPWIRFDDEVYRFGYSYVPQSEVGDLLNQYGLKPLDGYITDMCYKSRIVLQVHDSVVVDAHPEEVYDIMTFLGSSLEEKRVYGAHLGREVELSIPAEYAIGVAWQQGRDWKALPTQEEVEAYCEEILSAV